MPKQWICNVGATVIGEAFMKWVGQCIKERNEAVCQEKGMLIAMDQRVAEAFHSSTAVSRKCILFKLDTRTSACFGAFCNAEMSLLCQHADVRVFKRSEFAVDTRTPISSISLFMIILLTAHIV